MNESLTTPTHSTHTSSTMENTQAPEVHDASAVDSTPAVAAEAPKPKTTVRRKVKTAVVEKTEEKDGGADGGASAAPLTMEERYTRLQAEFDAYRASVAKDLAELEEFRTKAEEARQKKNEASRRSKAKKAEKSKAEKARLEAEVEKLKSRVKKLEGDDSESESEEEEESE